MSFPPQGPTGPPDHRLAAEVLLQSAMNHGNSGEATATIAMAHAVLALSEKVDMLVEFCIHVVHPAAHAFQGPQPDLSTGRWSDDLPTIDGYLKITRDLLRQFPDQPDAQIAEWAKKALTDRTFWPDRDSH